MKAINFINWKYIGLTGCLVASSGTGDAARA